jgi:hypothetical protein
VNRLPEERDMDQVVRSWMRHDHEHAADRNRQVGRIMGRVDETHQRRGAWRFLPFGRGRRRVDEGDEDLYVAGGGVAGVRRGVSSALAVAAVAVLLVMGVAFLALIPRTTAPGAGGVSPIPSASVHPDDVELMSAMAGVWAGERTTLDDVLEVYAEDAVHTVVWQDKVDRVNGAVEIRQQIRYSSHVDPSGWTRLPDAFGAMPGERRYLGLTSNLGGIACVGLVRDERIVRHDCILPMASSDYATPDFLPPTEDTLEVRDALWKAFRPGFGNGDRELIDATVSPDIVHHVAYRNNETWHTGIDEYMRITGRGEPVELAEPIPLPAPEGQHRWTDFSGVAGGSLCTFWEQDGLLIRHDCIVSAY